MQDGVARPWAEDEMRRLIDGFDGGFVSAVRRCRFNR
jgi:hypothetical protein